MSHNENRNLVDGDDIFLNFNRIVESYFNGPDTNEIISEKYLNNNFFDDYQTDTKKNITTASSINNIHYIEGSYDSIREKSIEKSKKIFKLKVLDLIKLNDFEYGYSSKSEEYVKNELIKNKIYIRDWINDLYIENISNSHILLSILRICGHLEYDDIKPQGITMAMGAFSHNDSAINEAGLRCFENWGEKSSLRILNNHSCKAQWLEEYRIAIIKDIEAYGV